eukprot:TRINITY_DN5854_c0_g2_i1.p1 TRINITY_DN5854_c0_g2~~TRINITY_DN5854_c0_g2_i1.p1  ORF type:complete len:535 (+),score=90.99 TRINITY_DN5854_c0_g2_i1:555-2159(+)
MNRGLTWLLTSPGIAAVEDSTIRWMCDLLGYNLDISGGVFTTGGSMSNLMACHCARKSVKRVGKLGVTVYMSCETHYSVLQALDIVGINNKNLRKIEVNYDGSIKLEALAQAIEEDIEAGYTPMMVVANMGTTNTGVCDDIASIYEIVYPHNIWIHADAAYGGFFMLTKIGKKMLNGIELADSITLDPHKALSCSYGVGVLCVKDRQLLYAANNFHGPYIPEMNDFDYESLNNIADFTFELTRSCRGSEVWLPLKILGISTFRNHLNYCIDTTKHVCESIREHEYIQVNSEPSLSVFTFYLDIPDIELSSAEHWEINQMFLEVINHSDKILIAPTKLNFEYCLRFCVLSSRTTDLHAETAISVIQNAAETTVNMFRRVLISRKNENRAKGFYIPYKLGYTKYKGLGVIAAADIKKGTLVWQFEEGTHITYTVEEARAYLEKLSFEDRKFWLNHVFNWNSNLCALQCDCMFMNHSSNTNIEMLNGDTTKWYASRDIRKGEPIEDDYGTHENPQFYVDLCEEYGVEWSAKVAELYS